VEAHIFDVAGLIEADQVLCELFDLLFGKNEAILAGS
jgi:hypothetical protein